MEHAGLRDLLIAALWAALAGAGAAQDAAQRLRDLRASPPDEPRQRIAAGYAIVDAALAQGDLATTASASRFVVEALGPKNDGDLEALVAELRDERTLQLWVLASALNLAKTHCDFGEPELALHWAQAAHACVARNPQRYPELGIAPATLLAAARKKLGDVEGALTLEREILRAAKDPAELETARLNLGASLARLGEHEKAIALQREALESMERRTSGLTLELVQARSMLLNTSAQRGNWAEAAEGFAEIVRQLDANGVPATDPLQTAARSGVANCDFYRGRIDAALQGFRDLLEALPSDSATTVVEREHHLQSIASLQFAKGEVAAARADMLRAIELASRRMRTMQTRRAQEAVGREIAQLVWCLLSCRDFNADDREQDATDLETIVRFRAGAAAQARVAGRIASRIAAGDARIRQLAERLRDARLQMRIGAEKQADLRPLRDAAETAERELLAQVGGTDLHAVELRTLARALPADAAAILVISYCRYLALVEGEGMPPPQPRFAAFLLERSGAVRRFELGDTDSIAAWVRGMRRWKFADPANRMPPAVASVFAALPAGVRTLFVCPDAELAEIPWALLALPSGEVVADRFRVVYGQSLDALMPAPPCVAPPGLLAVGGVDYGTPGRWTALPHSRAEVDAIAALFTARHADATPRIVTGAAADKAAIAAAMPGVRFLHLATHGFVEGRRAAPPEQPLVGALADPERLAQRELDTGLVFAQANTRGATAVLTAAELLALDLSQCELAVLSACDTNAGQRHFGEAVAGLNRALQLAGARATITSLWRVEDAAARRFFEVFYGALWGKPAAGVAAAFARAQRTVRDEGFADWGAFVLYAPPAPAR
jgi:tetratricopeptide (TPR) repeat protein